MLSDRASGRVRLHHVRHPDVASTKGWGTTMTPTPTAAGAGRTVRAAGNSEWLERLARAGYVVDGVLHVLIGVIVVQLAIGGGGGEEASQSGALSDVASTPLGGFALWVAVVAFAALGLWQATNAVSGVGTGGFHRDDASKAADVVKAAAKAVLYLALAVTSFRFTQGQGGSQAGQSQDVTASLVQSGPGRLLVGVIGVVVLAVGGYLVHKGVTKKFLEDLTGTGGQKEVSTAIRWLGTVGYVAKGVAIAVLGGIFVFAAVRGDASEATGLDGAFRTIGEQPFGPVLLLLTGLGFAAFGAYLFARARYQRM